MPYAKIRRDIIMLMNFINSSPFSNFVFFPSPFSFATTSTVSSSEKLRRLL